MALTTRVIQFNLSDVGLSNDFQGYIEFSLNVPYVIDTGTGQTILPVRRTYPVLLNQTDPFPTTDNAGTSPTAGNWGYNFVIKSFTDGTPVLSLSNWLLPSGGGVITLAQIIAAGGGVTPGVPSGPFLHSDVIPSDVGLVAWTSPPWQASRTVAFSSSPYQGALMLFKFRSGGGGTVNNVWYAIDTAGSGMANCFIGLYDNTGARVAQCTTNQSTNFSVSNVYNASLSAPYSMNPNTIYYVGMVHGTIGSAPYFVADGNATIPAVCNLGMTTGINYVSALTGSGFTALPASFTPSGTTPIAGMPVFTVS